MESLGLTHQELLSFVGVVVIFIAIIRWLLNRTEKLEHDKDELHKKVYDLAVSQIETNNALVKALEQD